MTRRNLAHGLAVALALGALGGCLSEDDKIVSPEGDTLAGGDARDTADSTAVPDADASDGFIHCDPREVVTGCPEGLICDTHSAICVECVGRRSRCTEHGRETCEAPVSQGYGLLTSGGFYEPDLCGQNEACVPAGINANCAPIVCEANASVCVDAKVRRCNASGTQEDLVTCDPGKACYEGQCEFLRHNVLLIFDTSGSMYDYIDPPSPEAQNPSSCASTGAPCLTFPACDDPDDPLTLITLAKRVFAESVQTAIGAFAQFALQRFPQIEAGANPANCSLGWYTVPDPPVVSGDDDAWSTAPGGWFDQNLRQVFVVPFPVRNNLDNQAELLEWLDNVESLGASDTPCAGNQDCGTGRCAAYNGERRCFYHAENELRVGGKTPLGKSLFYAGEYFQRFVVVDGKPCARSADCGSAGYLCKDQVCVDPYRKCRDSFIILFTDGEESEHQRETDFFNPVVQAKRLAYGLDCETDAGCRGGASCECADAGCASRRCVAPLWPNDQAQPYFDSAGSGALASPDGEPIRVRTTVINLTDNAGAARNRRIALAGGGVSIDVSAGDPDDFKRKLTQAMSPNYKCRPEDLETTP